MSKKKDGNKNAFARAWFKHWDDKRWEPLLEMMGLDDVETRNRVIRLLVVHLMLDSAVTSVLTVRFLDRRLLNLRPKKIEAAVAALSMSKRIELAQASHLITDSCAHGMKTVNNVRNKVAHFNPRFGWGVKHIKELSSDEAFEKFIEQGMRAFDEASQTSVSNMEAL